MTTEEALSFLEAHQPMPADAMLTDELIDKYDGVVQYFLEHPDARCLQPLLNSFGDGSGYGVYQLVESVVLQFPADVVEPVLAQALRSSHRGVKYWCLQLVPEFRSERLFAATIRCLENPDGDVRIMAATSLSFFKGYAGVLERLREALGKESEAKVRAAIEEAIEQLRQ
jgi:hypothetical protein